MRMESESATEQVLEQSVAVIYLWLPRCHAEASPLLQLPPPAAAPCRPSLASPLRLLHPLAAGVNQPQPMPGSCGCALTAGRRRHVRAPRCRGAEAVGARGLPATAPAPSPCTAGGLSLATARPASPSLRGCDAGVLGPRP
ncbi:unnamed protein product [Urochloa humidicola]